MKGQRTFASVLGLGLLGLIPGARAQTVWEHFVVAATNDVGQYASLALEPGTDRPFIGYRDSTNLGLRLARPVSSAGNCGPGNHWLCDFPTYWKFTDADIGDRDPTWISTAFHPDCGIHPSVSFVQGPGFALGVLGLVWGCGAQDVTGYADAQIAPDFASTSLRFSDSGDAVLSYQVVGSPSSSLWYARQSGQNWDTAAVASGVGVGESCSTAPSGGVALIAFKSEFGELWTAIGKLPAGFGNCGASNTWDCQKIDGSTQVLATANRNGSASGQGHIAYIAPTSGGASLKYASSVGTGGNCGGGAWKCITIEDVGLDLTQAVSIAVDSADKPIIAYHDKDDGAGNGVLKVARPKLGGNCGPKLIGVGTFTWECTTVDDGGGVRNVGRYLSIAANSNDLARVAYYDASDGNLLLAQEAPAMLILPPDSRSLWIATFAMASLALGVLMRRRRAARTRERLS